MHRLREKERKTDKISLFTTAGSITFLAVFILSLKQQSPACGQGGKQGNMEKRYLKWILMTAAVCILGLALTGAAGTH